MRLIHNVIIGAKFYTAGVDIPKEIVPPNLRCLAVRAAEPIAEPQEINLAYKHNQPYRNVDGFWRPAVQRQMVELQAEAEEDEAIEDEIADAPLDEPVAQAVEQAREDYSADVQRQAAQARYTAEQSDAVEDHVRQQQDANVDSGEFDQYDSPPRKPVSKKLFVKRKGQFVPAASVDDLIPGEVLFRHRKRAMGVAEKWIKHSIYE